MLEELIMLALSTLLGLGCFGSAIAIALNPETLDLDKIFSIIACVLLGMIFLGISAWMLFNTRLRELWRPTPAAVPPQSAKASVKKETAPEGVGKSSS